MRARHALDATAAARRRQSPGPLPVLTLLASLVNGCGEPVGDRSDRFETSPAPVLGRWIEREPTDDPPREAFVEAGEGVLSGRFEFERTALAFELVFGEATWDGTEILFVTGDVFGAGTETIPWTARLVPAAEGDPTILRLFPRVGGSVPFSVEYVRP